MLDTRAMTYAMLDLIPNVSGADAVSGDPTALPLIDTLQLRPIFYSRRKAALPRGTGREEGQGLISSACPSAIPSRKPLSAVPYFRRFLMVSFWFPVITLI